MNKTLLFCLMVVLLTAWSMMSQSLPSHETKSCVVVIDDPLPGSLVEDRGPVSGTAKIPAGGHLWVLAHKKLLAGAWWPQGNGETPVDTVSKFQIEAAYGIPEDRGDFEIVAVVVSDAVSKLLDRWVDNAPARQYPPIRFPPVLEGCTPAKVTVVKR
jgi:hypothetical protein